MERNANTFLGEAPVGGLMLKFSIPSILSLLIAALYNMVDQIFIGHGVGYLGNGATNVVCVCNASVSVGDCILLCAEGLCHFFAVPRENDTVGGTGLAAGHYFEYPDCIFAASRHGACGRAVFRPGCGCFFICHHSCCNETYIP